MVPSCERIIDRSINVVFDMIIGYRLIEYLIGFFCKCHMDLNVLIKYCTKVTK